MKFHPLNISLSQVWEECAKIWDSVNLPVIYELPRDYVICWPSWLLFQNINVLAIIRLSAFQL